MDLSINKALKDYLKSQFQKWYAEEVCCQVEEACIQLIDLNLSTVKPLGWSVLLITLEVTLKS